MSTISTRKLQMVLAAVALLLHSFRLNVVGAFAPPPIVFSTATTTTTESVFPRTTTIALYFSPSKGSTDILIGGKSRRNTNRSETSSSSLCVLQLVTEKDVLDAVEEAEKLWSQALEARKTANALSDRAEEEAEAAATSTQEVDALFKEKNKGKAPISMQNLAQADAAAKSSLDAGSMVSRALQAIEEADLLEKLAEEALQKSEEQLEQHLKDFPDSPFADDGDNEINGDDESNSNDEQ